MQQISFRAMGSTITIIVDSTDPTARSALTSARKIFLHHEQILSRFRPQSELSALNRAAGQGPRRVGRTLWQAVCHALRIARLSQGLVTPTVGAALIEAGYDRDFALLSASNEIRLQRPVPIPSWQRVICDPSRRTITLPAGVQLDLGGSAKGWTAAIVVRRLGKRFPTLVDAGGDIALSGPRRDGTPWPVEVADPRQPDTGIELLMVRRGGIATSGIDYRRWQYNGRWMHHVIDPRTGTPAQTDVLSATVIASSLPLAEMAAKMVVILGSDEGLRWLNARPDLAGLLVTTDGTVIRTATLARCCWRPAVESAASLSYQR